MQDSVTMVGYSELETTRCFKDISNNMTSRTQAVIIATITANILTSLFGTIANILIIMAYYRNRRLREPKQNFIYFVLAITDLVIAAALQPSYTVATIVDLTYGIKSCTIWQAYLFQTLICINLSLTIFFILSLQMFITLAYPYQQYITKYRLKMTIIVSCFFCLSFATVTFIFDLAHIAVSWSYLFSFIVFSTVMLTWKWSHDLSVRHQRAIRNQLQTTSTFTSELAARKKILRAARTTLFIMLSLFVCYILTLGIIFPFYLITKEPVVERNRYLILWCVSMTLSYLNSLVNPCVLLYRNSGFRESVRRICHRN